MNAPREPLLDDDALSALHRTRPWLYFLGILACIGAAFAALFILLAALDLAVNGAQGHLLVWAGIVLFLISAPTAYAQLAYAAALSRVTRAGRAELPGAVELACLRQRGVWIVNAFTVGVLAVVSFFQLLAALNLFR